MAADQFCLRWNNFQINITSALESLKCDEDLVDVTLTCEGQNVKAHKVILSACSPYFRNVFKENPCQHPVVILKDVRYEDVQALLSFMYQGEVYISQDRLAPFLHTAELLQVRGLAGAANPFKETQQQQHQQAAQPSPSQPKLRKPTSLPSVPPPSIPHHHQSHSRTLVPPPTPSYVAPEFPPVASPDLHPSVSTSPTLSQPASPQLEDSPLPLSKRRKAFPRRFASASGPPPSPVSDDVSQLPSLVKQASPIMTQSSLQSPGDVGVAMKQEPLPEEGADEDVVAVEGEELSPSIVSVASDDADCFSSSLGDEDSSGVPLLKEEVEEAGSPSSPQSQSQSVLMRSLAGAPPPSHVATSEDISSRMQRSEYYSLQPQPCLLCSRVFSNKFNLKQHIENVHLPGECVACPSCPKSFKNPRYLRKHMVRYHGASHRRIHTNDGRIIRVT